MSNAPLKLKRKRKNDEWYDWADGELPLPQAGRLRQLLGFSWRLVKAPFRWTWRQAIVALRWSWRQTVSVLRWSWRSTRQATLWSFRLSWTVMVWMITAPFRGLRWLFGDKEAAPQNRYEEIRQRIRRHYRRRNRFITHLFAFIAGNIVLWVDMVNRRYYLNPISNFQGAAVLSVFWAALVFYHLIRVRMADAEDRALESALEEERAWEQKQHFPGEEIPIPFNYGSRLAERDTWDEWEAPPAPLAKRKNR